MLNVQSHDLALADSVTLRTDAGAVLTFQVGPEVARDSQHPNTASHLRQHMTAVDHVTVRYEDRDGVPTAIQILDG
ncbi:MAG: hypothetical protein EXR58_00750 [Chloroflexi bacterium]|nr:hypothetical protein [Chloroflexota bacterium]